MIYGITWTTFKQENFDDFRTFVALSLVTFSYHCHPLPAMFVTVFKLLAFDQAEISQRILVSWYIHVRALRFKSTKLVALLHTRFTLRRG